MSKHYKVTVHDPVMRRITAEQAESYTRRTLHPNSITYPIVPKDVEWNADSILRALVHLLATIENRRPSDVLSDIASEPK